MKSKLILSTKLGGQGKTQLDRYFAQPPFKVLTLPAKHQELNAMQMSSSPGLLAGDELEIQLDLASNTALTLNTQAFSRVQSMNDGEFATQRTQITLAENSRLFYLPHPLVLHRESALFQRTEIEMADNSQLIYGEIVAIGRVLNQERFEFRQFSSYLQIFYQNRPLVIDRIQWQPARADLTALSQMENYSHQGSLIFLHIGKSLAELKSLLNHIQHQISEMPQLLIGASLLNEFGIIVRVLGHRADEIQALFQRLGEQLASHFLNNDEDFL